MYKKICNNAVYITILIFFVFGMWIYISQASSNVPIMDYWRFLNALVDKSYMSGISFSDLYSNNGVHRTPAELFLFLMNVKIFHWNTQLSMYIGTIIMAVYATLFYTVLKNVMTRKTTLNIGVAFILLNVFSFGAFEIITQEFYTSFALRMLSFAGGFVIVENILKNTNNKFNNKTVLLILYNVFTICIIGAAYSMAYSVAVIAIVAIDYLKTRKSTLDGINICNYVIIIAGIVLGDVLYIYGLDISMNNSQSSMLELFVSFFKGFITINGASLFGSEVSSTIIYAGGILVTLIHVIAIYIFLIEKIYIKTYLPLTMYIYYFVFYTTVFMGRSGFGVGYLASSRYIMDSCYALTADIIVFCIAFEAKDIKNRLRKVSIIVCCCFIMVGIISTDYHEIKIQNYRKIYCDNLIHMMTNIDEYSDDELVVFQAGDPQLVRSGIDLMKKYKLGIFHHLDESTKSVR